MPSEIAAAFAVLIGTLSTAILMAASYYWGPTQRQTRRDRKDTTQ